MNDYQQMHRSLTIKREKPVKLKGDDFTPEAMAEQRERFIASGGKINDAGSYMDNLVDAKIRMGDSHNS